MFTSILASFLNIFLCLGVLIVLAKVFNRPNVKGKTGELLISSYLKDFLDNEKYHILNNIMIPDFMGGTTQIDHIVLSQYGIFVIETKNMKGWIFGSAKSNLWTQQIYKVKNRFQNPFRQNYKHIVCISALTNTEKEYFHNIVVFVGNCTLKTKREMPEKPLRELRELQVTSKVTRKLLSLNQP